MPVDKSGSRIRQMFGEIAGRYDFMNHFLSGGTDVYWRWRTVRLASPDGDEPVLDVCTGTGDLAFAWRKTAGPNTSVMATDFTHGMLKLAEQKRVDRDVVFMEADTQELPFDDNLFQLVFRGIWAKEYCQHHRRFAGNDSGLLPRRSSCRAGIFIAR